MKTALNQRGSTTVEAAIIFPTIFLAILAIMYISIIKYQNISANAAVMRSSSRIAASWQYMRDNDTKVFTAKSGKDMLSKSDFIHKDPYRFIFDSQQDVQVENGKAYVDKLIRQIPQYYTTTGDNENIDVYKSTDFFLSYVNVSVDKSYLNPWGKLFNRFNVEDENKYIISTKAPLTSPAEFIRNVRLIKEIVVDNFFK